MADMSGSVGWAGVAEDIGDLERGPHWLNREAPPLWA